MGHEDPKSDVLSFFVSGYMKLISLIAGDVDLDHLVEMVTKFLHCKVTIFLFIIKKYLGGENKTPFYFIFY